jgi:GGDEF domain-containing protein
MDRCRIAIGELRIGSPAITTTASIGVATSPRHHAVDAEALVLAADRALYAAKARDGNCVTATTLATVETVEV